MLLFFGLIVLFIIYLGLGSEEIKQYFHRTTPKKKYIKSKRNKKRLNSDNHNFKMPKKMVYLITPEGKYVKCVRKKNVFNTNDHIFEFTNSINDATKFIYHSDSKYLEEKGYQSHFFAFWPRKDKPEMHYLSDPKDEFILQIDSNSTLMNYVVNVRFRQLGMCRSDGPILYYNDKKIVFNPYDDDRKKCYNSEFIIKKSY